MSGVFVSATLVSDILVSDILVSGISSHVFSDTFIDVLSLCSFLLIFNEFSARKCDDKQRCRSCDYYVYVFFHIGFMPFILFEALLISIVMMIAFIYNRHC